MSEYTIKDSGKREEFSSGMVRDTQANKVDYMRIVEGPMLDRWAEHLSKGAVKYPDVKPGVANWTLANSEPELQQFKKSAFRHFRKWLRGDTDEDHAAAIFFNVNGAEYVQSKLVEGTIDTRLAGTGPLSMRDIACDPCDTSCDHRVSQ